VVCENRDAPFLDAANRDRDSDESAPPEFPPEQPEADLNADGDQYGIEEEEEEEEEVEGEGVVAEGEDAAMAGAEDTAGPANDDDAESEAGSEEIDIEDSEDEEEEEGEEGAEEDMEMDEADPNAAGDKPAQQQPGVLQPGADVMVH
jgi:histone chaperone ASF1